MKLHVLAAAAAMSATAVAADDFTTAMEEYLHANIAGWVNDPVIVDAIVAQNAETAGLGADAIDELDQAWRAEVGGADTPTITPVLQNPAAEFLRARVEESQGVITEAFAMDAVGLNVAASDVTSDYWQGDEAKFSQTYGHGADAVHLGDVEFDESSQTYQGQVSVPVVDRETGEVVGALTVGLNAEALF